MFPVTYVATINVMLYFIQFCKCVSACMCACVCLCKNICAFVVNRCFKKKKKKIKVTF